MRPDDLLTAVSGVFFWWRLLPDEPKPAILIHRTFVHQAWKQRGVWGRAGLILGGLFSPLVICCVAVFATIRLGAAARKDSGKGRGRQLFEQLQLVLETGVPPPWYYLFEFYRDDRRADALDYLYRFETKRGIYQLLRASFTSAETTEALSNKLIFSERCLENGLEAIPVLGLISDGAYRRLARGPADELPHEDLFVKTIRGAGGNNADRWEFRGGAYVSIDGTTLSEAELLDRVRKASRERAYIIRRLVKNHPALSGLSPGALSTVRALTCVDERGGFELTHATAKMAADDSVTVDNAHAGGLAARVDLRTGILGPATGMGLIPNSGWHTHHPSTGALIEGMQLPDWDRVVKLACDAHALFPDQIIIGWDIALLASGPVLVEGNKGPGIDVLQRTHRAPLGSGRFGELVAFHLQRVTAAQGACAIPFTADPGRRAAA